ncbi:MAG: hypothetical protein KF870_13195 [Leadbetterella sp.]|nr:hypothetical protein [Leadbetterella sp.]
MKKYFFGLLAFIYAALSLYDLLRGNADGVISGIYFHRLFIRIFVVTGVLALLSFFTKSKTEWVKTLSMNVLIFGGLALVLEFVAYIYGGVLKKSELLPSHILWYDNPKYKPFVTEDRRFWGDIDPVIGRWRPANKTFTEISCDDSSRVTYRTNRFGARDQEWAEDDSPKIAFLGDSFTEGMLISEESRLSELLEQASGITHMNLGVLGANPLAYYLAYHKIIQPRFRHNGIIVGIYQGNDFDSFGFPANGAFENQPIYRAYWDTDSTKNAIKYSLARSNDSYESFYVQDHPDHLRAVRDSVFRAQPWGRKARIELETNSYLLNLIYTLGKKMAVKKKENHFIGLYENPEWGSAQTYDFLKSLDALTRETGDLPVLFVIIPDLHDVKSFKESGRENRFTPYVTRRYGSDRVKVVDLLPAFVQSKSAPENWYIPCDGHWNVAGNRFAFEYLVQQPEYKAFMEKVNARP